MTPREPRKVALFGGTFDPPHLGHLAIAEDAVVSCGLDRVIFIPCRQSPHKLDRPPTPGADRAEMLRLATRHLPWAEVSTDELERGEPSFSYITAERFHRRLPAGCALFWILGADQWAALDRWREIGILAELVTFIVFAREGSPLTPRPSFRSVTLRTVHPASATAIRDALATGGSPPPHLPPGVLDYIRQKGLYAAPGSR